MASSYLVRRQSAFHFRICVPPDLAVIAGRKEFRVSLRDTRSREAVRKASLYASHCLNFFAFLRMANKHLSPSEIAAMVADWRRRMFSKDAEVRRRIELGVDPWSLEQFATNCDATSDLMREQFCRLFHPPIESHPAQERAWEPPSKRVQAAAYAEVASMMTTDEVGDFVPLLSADELAGLDEISQRGLAHEFLTEGAAVYAEKWEKCLTLTTSETRTAVSAPAEIATPAALLSTATSSTHGKRVSEAWAQFVAEQAKTASGWRDGVVPQKARLAIDDFLGLLGDREVGSLTREDGKRFRDFQERRPLGNKSAYRGIDAATLERMDIPEADRQHSNTAQTKLAHISAFLADCVKEELLPRNPLDGLQVELQESIRREPWTPEEVRLLLDPDNMKAHSGLLEPRANVGYLPWLVVMGVYTGARMSEILGARIEDFDREDPHTTKARVPVLRIEPHPLRGIKTQAAIRKIPLHPDLIELGLFEYLDWMRGRGRHLWLDCPSKGGKLQNAATRHFRKYTENSGVYEENVKVFHSMRHAFKTMAEGDLTKPDLDILAGHSRSDAAGDVYSHPLRMPMHRHYAGICTMQVGADIPALRELLLMPLSGRA
ncbi:MAG: hypothetical protein JNN30_18195 [Rhodanobacteraceae bacterium]|nr:hypothetical protein [Rhodanobacteraceae bacterium]